MLVLSRRAGERILIGNDVKLTVIRVGPNAVRLGFEAPHDLNIVREELCIDLEPENTAADDHHPSQGIAAAS